MTNTQKMAKYRFRSFFSVYISFTIVRMFLTASFVYASSVQLGPKGEFEEFSEVIFSGEEITLECSCPGMSTCEMSLYLNDAPIYENGQRVLDDYDITKCERVPCCLNIRIANVTIHHSGTYKCREANSGTTMEDSYELNVVTEWPHCWAKSVESGNSFQLSCFTVGSSQVSMRWEISKGGSDPTVFLNFTQFNQNEPSFVKTVGVSHTNINKEDNLTIEYRCSHANDYSQSCFICLTCPATGGIMTPTTALETSQHTQQHQGNEQSTKSPVRNTIIVSSTAVLVILSVIAVILIYRTKYGVKNKCEEPNVRDKGQELSQTVTALKRLPTNHKDVQYEEITYICATEHSKEIEGKLPDEDTAIPSRDIYMEVEMCDCHGKNHLSDCDGKRHLSESNDDSKMTEEGAVSSTPDDFNTIDMVYCLAYKTFETE